MFNDGLTGISRTLDSVAEHNEAAAVAVMRAREHIQGDDPLKQRLLKVVEQLHLDADAFRELRDGAWEESSMSPRMWIQRSTPQTARSM